MKTLKKIEKKIIPILKKHNIKRAGFFGSYARGEEKKNSDIDLLVKLEKHLSLFDVIGIKLELEKVIKKKIDLVEYETIRPELKEIILKEEVLIKI
ncbi:nucleotidyltransferase domain-containing protein [Candidatus Pacearchaeota archaeon]|nr:nucleotidyltransferase domain-containing protein [Candidatus Pacearchaeota archaeon]